MGYSNEKIGEIMDAHRNSVSQWIHTYQQGGYDAIAQVGYGTNKSELETYASSITELFTSHLFPGGVCTAEIFEQK